MDNIWNVILYTTDEERFIRPKNNPDISGDYLCTCVSFWKKAEVLRYLQIMHYDATRNCWHDCGNASGISHSILAWTDKIKPCDFKDYDYYSCCFVEKQ